MICVLLGASMYFARIFFLSLTDLMRFPVEFCVVKFSSFGKDLMDYGIRSGKSLSLGMPMAPQDIQE